MNELIKNQKIIIELYETGKYSDLALAKLYNVSERTMQRFLQSLREKGKTKLRKDLPTSKTVSQISSNKFRPDITPLDWKIAKPSNKKRDKKSFTRYLVVADTHIPYTNNIATKVVLQVMQDIYFDGFVILGDFMDMEPISHWLRNKKKTLENKRMITDYIEGNRLLDEFDKRLPKECDKRFFYGNHENWYYQLLEEYPALEGLLEPKTELKLEERGYITYEDMNHIERIGKLNFLHGIYHAQNYVKKHIDELKTNIIIAHLHSQRERYSCSPAREIAIAGYCIGCLCDLSPDYMKNKPHKWTHGFAVVQFYGDGYFNVDLIRIVKGITIYNGKMYNGNLK